MCAKESEDSVGPPPIPSGREPATFKEVFSFPALAKTWRLLMVDLRSAPSRDCVDFLDVSMNQDRWIGRLRQRILDARYRPRAPQRKEFAKSGGTYRVITMPMVDDLLVYRH